MKAEEPASIINPLRLIISVDVEEEGLFRGCYPRQPAGVANVRALTRLAFIRRDFDLPLTLLVTYQVAQDQACRELLLQLREKDGAELGVHLHPWNTPPFQEPGRPEPVPTAELPPESLARKLANLVASHQEAFGTPPRSFRMGRFDWHPTLFALLPHFGLRVDSSISPLSRYAAHPANFFAPAEPFWLWDPAPGRPGLLEVPLTTVPLWPAAPRQARHLGRLLPPAGKVLLMTGFSHLLAQGLHPAWFPLGTMRRAVNLHRARGGRVLTLFLHSSELYPGGTPQFSTPAAVEHLVAKLHRFLTWLTRTYPVAGETLFGLYGKWQENLVENREKV